MLVSGICALTCPIKRHAHLGPINSVILITGFFFFGAGTYASVQSVSLAVAVEKRFSTDTLRCRETDRSSILVCPKFPVLTLGCSD